MKEKSCETFWIIFRAGKIEEALTFAQTRIAEAGESNPEVLNELERTLALLAFEKPQNSPFSDLLDQTHRQKVASELNAAILKMEQLENSSPRMINLLKLMNWSQSELEKRNVSYPKIGDLSTANIEYPNKWAAGRVQLNNVHFNYIFNLFYIVFQ